MTDRPAILALAERILAGDSRMITRALVADLVSALREAEAALAGRGADVRVLADALNEAVEESDDGLHINQWVRATLEQYRDWLPAGAAKENTCERGTG